MGNKMKAGNPDIADLSDKNRPTKLAETYTELYDNEWTDALDTLQNSVWGSASKDEKDSVKQLYSILMVQIRFILALQSFAHCEQLCHIPSFDCA